MVAGYCRLWQGQSTESEAIDEPSEKEVSDFGSVNVPNCVIERDACMRSARP
jgi:hypothetical protein